MMCDPCFMDANQVGYVHELTWDDVKKILDDAITVKPRRQMTVQFSGGEPTLSPHFLEADRLRARGRLLLRAVRDQRHPLRAGARLRQGAPRRRACAWPTCSSTASATRPTAHRKIGNLFDVKLRAIENLQPAGIDVILVVTVVNGVNNDQVGPIVQLRDREQRQDHASSRSSRCRSPAATRTSTTTTRAAPALHAVAPRARRQERRPASPSRCATGSRSRRSARSSTSPTC